MDLAAKLKIPPANKEPAILIVDTNGMQLGLQVSSVDEVAAFTNEDLSGPAENSANCIVGVAKRDKEMILILNPALVVPASEILVLAAAQSQVA